MILEQTGKWHFHCGFYGIVLLKKLAEEDLKKWVLISNRVIYNKCLQNNKFSTENDVNRIYSS